jgi:peptide-methionine (S)-S-oxide reductase
MNKAMDKIGFGGGCHWCTEAVFQSLSGVHQVDQGYIASTGAHTSFSEAVIVHYNPLEIPLQQLIEIHLRTHKSAIEHQLRNKYRSAIYVFSTQQSDKVKKIIHSLQKDFDMKLITKVLFFNNYRPSLSNFTNYYYSNPNKPFCKNHIDPKLNILLKKFANRINKKKLNI